MDPENKKKLVFIGLSLILLFSFVARIYPIQTVHWWDETVYLQHAEIIVGLKEDNYSEFNLRPPLLSIFFGIIFLIWQNVIAASFLVALIGVIGVFYAYLLGEKLYNKKVGLIAAAILGLTPFIVQHSRTLLTDVPSLTLLTIGFYYFIVHFQGKKTIYGVLAGAFFALAFLMRFTSIILLLIIPLYIYLNSKDLSNEIKNTKIVFLSFIGALIPYFVWSQIQFGLFFSPVISAIYAVSSGIEPIEFYFINLFEAYTVFSLIGFILFLIFFLKDKIQKNKLEKESLFLLIWFIAFIIFMSFTPHKEIRYLITPISLPLILISALGVNKLIEFVSTKKFILKSATFILLILLAFVSFQPAFERLNEPFINSEITTEEYEVSNFINNLNLSIEIDLYTNNNYPVFGYYTNHRVIRIKEVGEDFYSIYPKNMEREGILILYKNFLSPTKEWADSKPEFEKIKEFDRIILYTYSPS